MICVVANIRKVAAACQEDHRIELFQTLGDPEPHIGGPRDQSGLGMGAVEISQHVAVLRLKRGGGGFN